MISELITENYLSNNEPWHKNKLSYEEAVEYHNRLLLQGNIIYSILDDKLEGYIEVWKIDYKQLGRLICASKFYVYDENITDGNVAYIANMWIKNEETRKILFKEFFYKFGECEFLAGERTNRNNAFKVYNMDKVKGVLNGQRKADTTK